MMLHFPVFLLPASLPLGCLANPLPDLFIHYYFKLLYQFLCMGVLHACLHTRCAVCPGRPEEGPASPGTEVTEVCEQHMGAGN